MSSIRVGSTEVTFPANCIGRGDLEICPEIVKLIKLGRSNESNFRERAENTAKALGEEACANCPGLRFADSDSGITWIRRCMLTGLIEES